MPYVQLNLSESIHDDGFLLHADDPTLETVLAYLAMSLAFQQSLSVYKSCGGYCPAFLYL